MKKSVCYVDDDSDELKRFRSTFQDRYILGIGTTLDDALNDLGKNKPDLFLLDLYFGPTPSDDERRIMLEADAKLTKQENEVRQFLASFRQEPGVNRSPGRGGSLAREALQFGYGDCVRDANSVPMFLAPLEVRSGVIDLPSQQMIHAQIAPSISLMVNSGGHS